MRALLLTSLFLANVFAVSPALAQRPVMERVTPSAGPPGTRVQIIGRHLGYRSQVFLGDVELPVHQRLPNRWTVEIPSGAPSGPILLRTNEGSYAGPFFRVTAARPAPAITGLEPAAAPPGSEVAILGQNFSARLGDNDVTLAGRRVVVRSATPTALRVILPSDATSGTFTVQVDGSLVPAESPRFEVTVGTSITAIEPPRAPPGAEVTLRGTGFSGRDRDNRVTLAGRRVRVVGATETALTVRLPRRAASGRFELDVRGGGHAVSPPFMVAEALEVSGFTPTAGPPGTEVTLQGEGFGRDVRQVVVTLGGRAARVRSVSPEAIVVVIPDGASGPFEVTVAGVAVTSRESFGLLGALRVESFSPTSGAAGSLVTLRGQGFAPVAAQNLVTLGGVRQDVISASPRGLRVRIVRAASGPFEVRANGAVARSSQPFLVQTPPAITAFSPTQGPPGTEVTLTGSGFGDSARLVRVTLGRRRLPVVSVRDDRLVVTIPRRARSGRIEVEVGTQGGAASATVFTVGDRVRVGDLEPREAMIGAQLTVRGEGFPQGTYQVAFTGPRRAIRADRESPVAITVVVPNGARTGPVDLVFPDGRRQSLGSLTVTETPAGVGITSVAPECAEPGCPAVLRGYGFDPRARNDRVTFRGQPVVVRSATATALTIVLPDAPGNGRFSVSVRGRGEGTSPPFYVQRGR